MIAFSLVIWGIFALIISWFLGVNLIDKVLPIKYCHQEENPLVILLVGFIALAVLWLVLKVFN